MSTEQRRALAATIPTTEVIKDAVTFPRDRLGEPLDISPERFDAWLARVRQSAKAEALREAADSVHDNAASPYCLPCHRDDADLLHTIATEYEREPERGAGR